ncbi:MAG: putative maltokinase, partial [Fibrobacter sp.]|nr:putative maltokinase [Fibrobacter sp.]
DGAYEQNVQFSLYNMMSGRKHMKGTNGNFTGMSGRELKTITQEIQMPLKSRNLKIDQSNTAVVFGELLFLKIYRKLDEGINPELEMMHFLGEKVCFTHIPPFAGALQYKKSKSETYTIAILQGYVENSGNAWTLFSGFVSRFFEQVLSSDYRGTLSTDTFIPLVNISSVNVPPVLTDMVGELFMELITLLGRRTAEMHIALCQQVSMPEFSPEPFTQLYQRSLFQSMQGLVLRTFGELEKHKKNVPKEFLDDVETVLELKGQVIDSLRRIVKKKISSLKIRIHGDYHLGQVLYTGKDFIIMDFEGEPARPLSERKLKRSPFMDVAGMIRSFHYVAYSTLFQKTTFRETDLPVLEAWISPWYHYISGLFLNSYLQTANAAPFIPSNTNDVTTLIQTYLLEKAVYELGYEMNNRPDWLLIPLRSIESLIKNISKNK